MIKKMNKGPKKIKNQISLIKMLTKTDITLYI